MEEDRYAGVWSLPSFPSKSLPSFVSPSLHESAAPEQAEKGKERIVETSDDSGYQQEQPEESGTQNQAGAGTSTNVTRISVEEVEARMNEVGFATILSHITELDIRSGDEHFVRGITKVLKSHMPSLKTLYVEPTTLSENSYVVQDLAEKYPYVQIVTQTINPSALQISRNAFTGNVFSSSLTSNHACSQGSLSIIDLCFSLGLLESKLVYAPANDLQQDKIARQKLVYCYGGTLRMNLPINLCYILRCRGLSSSQLSIIHKQCCYNETDLLEFTKIHNLEAFTLLGMIGNFEHKSEKMQLTITKCSFQAYREVYRMPYKLQWLRSITRATFSHNQGFFRPDSLRRPFHQMKNLKHLDLSDNLLTSIKGVVWDFPYLESLVLCNNHLSTLADSCAKLPALTYLNLRNNLFDDVPQLTGGKLRILKLGQNFIKTISASSWSESWRETLTHLDLAGNPAKLGQGGLKKGCFAPLKALNKLELCTLLTNVGKEREALSHLGLRCQRSCACLNGCKAQRSLYIFDEVRAHDSDKMLPKGYEVARKVDISESRIPTHVLQRDLPLCASVTDFLARASFISNPSVILETVGARLTALDLSYNIITQLTTRWDCPCLEVLNLSHNRIEWIDEQCFVGMHRLRQVLLHHNKLSDRVSYRLPQLLADCTALEHIDLSHNRFTHAKRGMLGEKSAQRLRKLSLAYNRLTSIEVRICEGLRALEELDLSNNGLVKLEGGALMDAEDTLTNLNLACNMLDHLPPDCAQLKKLRWLNLSWNNFRGFPLALFSLEHLSVIKVEGNRISPAELKFALAFQRSVDCKITCRPQLIPDMATNATPLVVFCADAIEVWGRRKQSAFLADVLVEGVPLPHLSRNGLSRCLLFSKRAGAAPPKFIDQVVNYFDIREGPVDPFEIWKVATYIDDRELVALLKDNMVRLRGSSIGSALEHELQHVIGMNEVKIELQRLVDYLHVHHTQRADKIGQDHEEILPVKMNIILEGNPGTGKTKIARLLAKILFQLGITRRERVLEVQAPDLVSCKVNKTAARTRAKIKEAQGGILFIDEAYRLLPEKEGQIDHGREALDTIMEAMDGGDNGQSLIFIFAGYNLSNLIRSNEGLYSRISQIFRLSDYTSKQLALIYKQYVSIQGWKLRRDVEDLKRLPCLDQIIMYRRKIRELAVARETRLLQQLANLIGSIPLQVLRRTNARLTGELFRLATLHQATRWLKGPPVNWTRKEKHYFSQSKRVLLMEDVNKAIKDVLAKRTSLWARQDMVNDDDDPEKEVEGKEEEIGQAIEFNEKFLSAYPSVLDLTDSVYDFTPSKEDESEYDAEDESVDSDVNRIDDHTANRDESKEQESEHVQPGIRSLISGFLKRTIGAIFLSSDTKADHPEGPPLKRRRMDEAVVTDDDEKWIVIRDEEYDC